MVKNIFRPGRLAILFIVMGLGLFTVTALAADSAAEQLREQPKTEPSLEAVLDGLEQRYLAPSYSARFHQESPLPDIQITERAEGKAFFKRPGKFRWSYESPDVLDYISDGDRLWIHSPMDNTVWIGKADDFFGKGGSAGVLTDIRQIRSRFTASLVDGDDDTAYRIQLVPMDASVGIHNIYLAVDRTTFDIVKLVSFNVNGEETRIMFTEMRFDTVTDEGLFNFTVPEKAVIIPLD